MIDLGFVPLVPLPVAFTVASLVLGLIAIGGLYRYRDAFNPLVFFAIYEGLFQTLLSAWIALSILSTPADAVSRTLVVATLYFIGTAVVFLPVRLFGARSLIRRWLLRGKRMSARRISGRRFHIFFVAIAFLLVFLALMVASGAGTLWITNPRMAYQNFRAGSGFLFLLVQWISISGLLIYLFGRPQTILSSLKALAIYVPIASFTGSKAAIISGLVLWSSFCNFSIRRIPIVWLLGAIALFIPLILSLLVVQGAYGDLFEALDYFKDYVATTATFLGRFDDFGLRYGSASFSDLWFYVPRSIYPAKPFEYGLTLIHQVLFPGMAELGHTPGILPWALPYLDFGTFGVFASGVIGGMFKRLAYEFFLERSNSIFAFVLVMQLALFPIFIYANLPISLAIAFLLARYFRLRFI
jgi:hypothetical protein